MNPADEQVPLQRKHWLSVLAKASTDAIESACMPLGDLPQVQWLRQPETGLVMVRGRIGGTGAIFNLGEAPVTRCALRLQSASVGNIGVAWVQGRDVRHAELAARLDAMLQEPQYHKQLRTHVINPLAALQAARRDHLARKAAATKVEFYTLARGEDK